MLLRENKQAFRLLTKVTGQLRVTMGSVIGFDLAAVYRTAEIMRIPLTPALVDKVSDIENYLVKKANSGKG